MTLKQRKRTSNGLPHFDNGLNGGQNYNQNIKWFPNDPSQMQGGIMTSPINTNTQGVQGLDKIDPVGYQNARSKVVGTPPSTGGGISDVQAQGYAQIATSAVQFAGATATAFGGVQREEDIINSTRQSTNNVGGVQYQQYNQIDKSDEIKKLNLGANTLGTTGAGAGLGAAIGTAIVPGLGSLIGGGIGAVVGLGVGLFGGAARKRKLNKRIANAQSTINRMNLSSRTSAETDYLQQAYNQENTDSTSGVLYAKQGKDLKQPAL